MSSESGAKVGVAQTICLVVPCYNEARRLNADRFVEFLTSDSATRILFVDDGSADDTLAVLEQLRRRCEGRISILPCQPNVGKAETVRRGILYALDTFQPPLVGFWDADLATSLQAVQSFSDVLASRPDIEMVFGARVKLLGRQVERRAVRHYLGRIFATAVSTMLRMPIYDTQCGAKLFRVQPETRQIFAAPFLSRWVFDVEIIARYLNFYGRDTKRLASAIYEYPLEAWVDVAGSKVHALDFFVAFRDIVRIRHKYLS